MALAEQTVDESPSEGAVVKNEVGEHRSPEKRHVVIDDDDDELSLAHDWRDSEPSSSPVKRMKAGDNMEQKPLSSLSAQQTLKQTTLSFVVEKKGTATRPVESKTSKEPETLVLCDLCGDCVPSHDLELHLTSCSASLAVLGDDDDVAWD
jgi:hypothetical protein